LCRMLFSRERLKELRKRRKKEKCNVSHRSDDFGYAHNQ
jgi:hypothetical protein